MKYMRNSWALFFAVWFSYVAIYSENIYFSILTAVFCVIWGLCYIYNCHVDAVIASIEEDTDYEEYMRNICDLEVFNAKNF